MKEGLRRLRGTAIATDLGEISLCDTYREDDCQFDQLYYTTEHDSITVKVYSLEKQESGDRFRHQQYFFPYYRQVYLRGNYEQLAQTLVIKQLEIKKIPFGIVVMRVCKGTTLKQTANTFIYGEWLTLTECCLKFIQNLRSQKQVYLNFQPSNIAKSTSGELKITDPEFLTQEGSFQQIQIRQQHLMDICEQEYLYKPPQLLDEYSKCKIDYRADLFSFGIVLYQMLFNQYPFESRLAQISCNYKTFPSQQSFFTSFISKLLKPYNKRQSIQNLKIMIEAERKKVPKETTSKSMNSGSTAQSKGGNIFSGLTQMFSKLTTETESWYLSYTENDQNPPEEKYLNMMVSKLYKKEGKLQKLQSIVVKYLQQGNMLNDQARFFKTALLLLQILRRGPNFVSYQWDETLQLLQSKAGNNSTIGEMIQFFKQKVNFHSRYSHIFKGNFYIDDFAKFKLVNVEVLEELEKYLTWLLNSIKSRFLFVKKEDKYIQYLKELYCDEILDIISMLIFSVICIRKDNELKLRKDPLDKIANLEKKLNTYLQKISYLSNHVDGHGIYSLEGQYVYYQEQIQIRDAPYSTTLEHFYKYARQYKGLCIPQNYALTLSTGDHKQFLSNENNHAAERFQVLKEKQYFQDEEEQSNDPSFKVIPPKEASPEKKQLQAKFLEQLKESPKRKPAVVETDKFFNFNMKSTSSKESAQQGQVKKMVSFDQFFNIEGKPSVPKSPEPKGQAVGFPNFGAKVQQQNNKQDFSFFDDFFDKSKPEKAKPLPAKDKKLEQNFHNFFADFSNYKQKEQKQVKKQKSALVGSSSQKMIQDISQTQHGMKKSAFELKPSPKKNSPSVDPALLQNILSGLRLKELKDVIVENQNVIIAFEKLKLDKVIGSGSAGQVYFGSYNGEPLAIKKVKTKQNPNALKQFERQLLTYIKMKRNKYLVSLVGLSRSNQDYYLLTEFCNAGSLFDILHKKANTISLSWKQKVSLAIQIAQGMLALHQMKPPIIHRDLKSLNVFVLEKNGAFTAKVADFGLSRSPQSQMMTMYLGTLHWMAPQLLDNKQYSIKVDIYSFAIVLWQICSRKTPYNELASPMAIIKHVTIQRKRPNLSVVPPDCPPQLIQIMKVCWSHEPNERPCFSQIIERLKKIPILF